MRDYGKIKTSIWRSDKFQSLTDHTDQLFYFYLHTCPHVNSVGCFVLPLGYAVEDLGWEKSRIDRAIEALSEALLIAYHKPSKTLRIIDYLTHDPISNGNHAKGAVKIAMGLPDSPEKLIVFNELASSRFVERDTLTEKIEALSIDLSKGLSDPYRTPEPEPYPYPEPERPGLALVEPDNNPEPPIQKFTPEDFRLAEWIFEGVLAVAPKTKPPNLDTWADTIRLMRERDNRDHREIAAVFKYANQNAFWSANILSPSKLRDQFAQLDAHMRRSKGATEQAQAKRPSL